MHGLDRGLGEEFAADCRMSSPDAHTRPAFARLTVFKNSLKGILAGAEQAQRQRVNAVANECPVTGNRSDHWRDLSCSWNADHQVLLPGKPVH